MRRLALAVAKWGAIGIVVTAVGLAGLGFWYWRAIEPQIAGTISLPGFDRPVEVIRDREGVAHIFAASDEDAAAALGFVHAQDRLWQMDFQRRIGAGRLAEIVGQPGLEADRFLRTIGIRRTAEAIFERLGAETRGLLNAYSRGVNAYLETHRGPLPPEFYLLRAPAPEPWKPVDSISWTLMMALDLGGNMNAEINRMRLAQAGLSNRQIREFLPLARGETWPETADFQALYRSLGPETRRVSDALRALGTGIEGVGSNNWVLGGTRTTTGRPLLANDPHLGLAAPTLWYFARMTTPSGTVIGATLPGAPGVVLGRNDRIAWGFTNTGPDVQDLYIERLDPRDPTLYEAPDGWRKFETRPERIRVRGAADVDIVVRVSRNGPVISDGASRNLTGATPAGHAIALRWTALDPDNRTVEAAFHLNKARDWDTFLAATRLFSAPQQNIVYADVDGNIGFVAAGRVPIRKPENDLKGLFPAPGWDARYDWAGFIPFDELPREFNPARGYRATANARIAPADYAHPITFEWEAPFRTERIEEMIAARDKHDAASFTAMLADHRSRAVIEFLPLLTTAPPAGERERAVIERMRRFDGTMAIDRAEPLIYAAWMRELTRLVYADELGPPLFADLWEIRPIFMSNVLNNRDGQGEWCRTRGAAPETTCTDLITRALTLALDDLTRRYGADQSQWRWGAAHEARSEHRPLGRSAELARFFDIRVQTPGDTYTVNVGRHTIRNEREPFVSHHAASLRAIYDLADPERSVFIHSTGQSGLPTSPLYNNLADRWARVDFIPMRTNRVTILRDPIGVLAIRPR